MSVAQTEFVAYKAENTDRLKKMEDVITKTMDDVKKLQDATDQISIQAAPLSTSIEAAVAASEAKAQFALTEVRSLYEGAKIEVEDIKRIATEVEKKSGSEKKGKWELSRPTDIDPDIFGSKDEVRAKFKDGRMDYVDAVHPGGKLQLEWTLKQRDEVTQEVLAKKTLGSTEEDWTLRFELFKLLKRKTEVTSEARKIVECVSDANGHEVWRLLGVRYEPQVGMNPLKELGELTMLQNKRCKSTAETAMIVL